MEWSKMRKIFALIAIIAGTVIFGSWVWTHSDYPIFPTVVIVLAVAGTLSLFWKHQIFKWAGVCVVWAFYAPVLLALVQVSVTMAMIWGGWAALFYVIWAPLRYSGATVWLVQGQILGLYHIQWIAPILIFIGSALLVMGLAQIVESKLRKTGFVTGGLYSLVRHPQYLGVNILTFGFVLYGLRPIDFIAWATLVFLHILLAGREEGRLQEKFGNKYLEYKKRVPFIIPFVPNKLMQRFGGPLPGGWKIKTIIGIYLLTMAILLTVLWVAWWASGSAILF